MSAEACAVMTGMCCVRCNDEKTNGKHPMANTDRMSCAYRDRVA